MADIQLITSSFTANDAAYLLYTNGSQLYIDDDTQFTDNICNQSCILSMDSSLNMNGDTQVFNQNDIFVVLAHDPWMDIASTLCIRNALSTTVNPYFNCIHCDINNTKIIFDECSNPYTIPSHVSFVDAPANITASHSQIYDVSAQKVGQQLTCGNNTTFCEIHCMALVSCFASTITSNAVITNIFCKRAYSCQNAQIYAVANRSHTVPSVLHIICRADSACQENTIIAKGHHHFQLDCVTTASCIDSTVNISDTTTSAIHCYAYGACDNLVIYTDNDNTTFLFYQYSSNVQIHNLLGYIESNLQCGASNAYITLDASHPQISSAISKLFTSDIPNSFDFYGPCDSIQFTCNRTSQCTMSSSLTRPDAEPDFLDFYQCYGQSYYKDISHQHCVGSRECGGPTQSPTAAPSFSPTQQTISPTSAPSVSPTNDPTNAPTVSPTTAPSYSPSAVPSNAPTSPPTTAPSAAPSFSPTLTPTVTPSTSPSAVPSVSPTITPSTSPTMTPSATPTLAPSAVPTASPSLAPSTSPTLAPTAAPSTAPTLAPSDSPTSAPSTSPTLTPTVAPSWTPTSAPTIAPTLTPSASPSIAPTIAPTAVPTTSPTLAPTVAPSASPTLAPTSDPTIAPTMTPSASPTIAPTIAPSAVPTTSPTMSPTRVPTSTPTKSPTATPSMAPTMVPTTPPTSAPSGTPTASPSIAPTPIPTRQPTVPNGYDSFIDIVYGLKYLENVDIQKIVHNPVNITDNIRLCAEWGYAVDENLVVDFDDFWVQILKINEFAVTEIVVQDRVALSNSRDLLRLTATMKCDEAICHHIIEKYDQHTFEQRVTNHTRDYFANIQVNQNAESPTKNAIEFVVLSHSAPMELNPPKSKATNYVFIVTTAMVILLIIMSFWAAIYNSWKCCILPGFGIVDDGRWGALMIFALQFWDFVSDVNLAIEILSDTDLTTDMLILISGVGSVTFVMVPYLANLLIAVRIKDLVKRNEAAKAWFQQNTAVFTILVVVSGGCYPALAVVSSNIFGLRITSCGLTQYELKQMGKIKILGTILLENLPQLVCQALYSLAIGSITQTVALAFFASFLSVTASSLSYLIDRDSSDTPPVQYYLTTRRVEQLIDPNDINDDDDDDDGMHLATVPYTAIRTVLSDSADTEIVYGQTPGNDDGVTEAKEEDKPNSPKYMIRVTSASIAKPANANETAESDANILAIPGFNSLPSTSGNSTPSNTPSVSTTPGEGEGISAVVTTNGSAGATTPLRRIVNRLSLTHDKTDITAFQRKQFVDNRGRTHALGEQIAEVFAMPPKNIEVGYSNITKKGIITHIVHYVFEEDLESIAAEHLEVSPQIFTEQLCIAMSRQLTNVFTKHFGLTKGDFETNYSHKKRNRRLTVQTDQDDVVKVEKKKKVMKRLSHQIKVSQNIELAQLRKEFFKSPNLDGISEDDEEEESWDDGYGNEEAKAKRALNKLFSSRGVLRSNKEDKLNMISELLLDGMNDDFGSEDNSKRKSDRYSKSNEANLLEYIQETDKEMDGEMMEDDTLRIMASDTDDAGGNELSTQL